MKDAGAVLILGRPARRMEGFAVHFEDAEPPAVADEEVGLPIPALVLGKPEPRQWPGPMKAFAQGEGTS